MVLLVMVVVRMMSFVIIPLPLMVGLMITKNAFQH